MLVIPTNEELEIARHTLAIVKRANKASSQKIKDGSGKMSGIEIGEFRKFAYLSIQQSGISVSISAAFPDPFYAVPEAFSDVCVVCV